MLQLLSAFLMKIGGFRHNTAGAAAVEFAMIAPVLLLITAGITDYGRAVYSKYDIENVVSAGANYALVNGSSVSASGAGGLATSIATILSGNSSASKVSGSVKVNNGTTATLSNGTIVKTGTASAADSCYCPTKTGLNMAWGSAVTCGNSCGASGALAGKFVEIKASRPFTPFFSDYGFIVSDEVAATAVVQVQ